MDKAPKLSASTEHQVDSAAAQPQVPCSEPWGCLGRIRVCKAAPRLLWAWSQHSGHMASACASEKSPG